MQSPIPNSTSHSDSGLACLVLLCRFLETGADPAQLLHQFGKSGEPFSTGDIIIAARSLNLRAKLITSSWQRLTKTPLPAIARLNKRQCKAWLRSRN